MTLKEVQEILKGYPSGTRLRFSGEWNGNGAINAEAILEIEDGEFYLCQDVRSGSEYKNKHDKKYSYVVAHDAEASYITSLEVVGKPKKTKRTWTQRSEVISSDGIKISDSSVSFPEGDTMSIEELKQRNKRDRAALEAWSRYFKS